MHIYFKMKAQCNISAAVKRDSQDSQIVLTARN